MKTITAAAYHAGSPDTPPELSASIAKILLNKSPRHAWLAHPRLNPNYQPEEEGRFDLGTAAHALLLEGDDKMTVCDFPDWRTKAAQQARDDARAAGRTPILPHHYQDVQGMVKAAHEAIAECQDLQGITLADGMAEQSFHWREGETYCKARMDWVSADCQTIIDYKTTDVSTPDSWMRSIHANNHDLQAAFYLRAMQVYSEMDARFTFMVQETTAPYAVYFVGMSPTYLEIGRQKMNAALKIWQECMRSGKWPEYTRQVMYPEPTAWALTDAEEKAAISQGWTVEGFLFGKVRDEK